MTGIGVSSLIDWYGRASGSFRRDDADASCLVAPLLDIPVSADQGKAKKLAADRRSNVSAIVNEALRAALKRESASASTKAHFQMPTFLPAEAKAADTTPDAMYELMVAEELGDDRG
jgi:hypothetical protein